MARIHHTTRARDDLIEIWVEIARDNPAAADRIYERLENRVIPLASFPLMGSLRPDIAVEARILVEDPYLILYRRVGDGVQIVRVIHGARQIDSALFEEGLEGP